MAVGSLVGSVALRPNSPLTSTVIATSIIVASALVVDLGYAWGLIPANVVQARPVLLYANGEPKGGEQCSLCSLADVGYAAVLGAAHAAHCC